MKEDDITQLLKKQPKTNMQLDATFTNDTIQRIRLTENAKSEPKKRVSIMKQMFLRPFKSVPMAVLSGLVVAAGVGASALGYMWYQSSVKPVGNNGSVSMFEATGCPNYFKLQHDPEALKAANLSTVKKFELRPDIELLPEVEKQKIVQAYCEINQLQAYANTHWPNSEQTFTNIEQVLTVKSVSAAEMVSETSVIDHQNPSRDAVRDVIAAFSSKTIWLEEGRQITHENVQPGDVVAVVKHRGTEANIGSSETVAVVKLPLEARYYSQRVQSSLFPLSDCDGSVGEECAETNVRAQIYLPGQKTAAPQQDAVALKRLQAKITAKSGGAYKFTSRGGKVFQLILGDIRVDNNEALEVGDYLDLRYSGEEPRIETLRDIALLMYSANGKWGPFVKYTN